VFRWLKRGLQLDTLRSDSPGGMPRQGAVALITYGLRLLYPAGGALSLQGLPRRVKRALPEALFAAGVGEGERRAQEREIRREAGLPLLRAAGSPGWRWPGGTGTHVIISFLTHSEIG
jgi:hypothetical protein